MSRKDVKLPRPNLFDNLRHNPAKNMFCKRADLNNEASVEAFFVNRLLEALGYRDSQIQTKKSIYELAVPRGSSKIKYKPDYVLTYRNKPKWVIDAKSSDVSLNKWVEQCSGYCLLLNQQFQNENPVEFFVLTNGILTHVYQWDVGTPSLELCFSDFNIGNPRYEQLRSVLSSSQTKSTKAVREIESCSFTFKRPHAEEAKRIFAQCHKIIWKSEGYSPTAAFMEFVKLMFVKMWSDRELREDEKTKAILEQTDTVKLPKASVTFSSHWIKSNKSENPINDVLFKQLRAQIERDVAFRKKKRIFEKNEEIVLRPDTIKSVVRRLEHFDMFGIDEDLNGRLFETFLSATMRGRELGQYFTPRSIVKLMTRMAHLKATPGYTDKVIDACCGTGGFLIEILTDMREKIRNNESLTFKQKEDLLEEIANESIYGIDFGKSPPIAKIARINMYLHGDGGSRIYYADSLDKELQSYADQEPEVLENQDELRKALRDGLLFKKALTNPPFSMTKELSNDTEARILKNYDLASEQGTIRFRSSLRSSAMFIERYRDLLLPGGKLFTVIDETLLSSGKFDYVRDFIRRDFIIRAIISLPGDAFRRAGARVKTSVLCLEKKISPDDEQPRVFYAFAKSIGVDDLPSKASEYEIEKARKRAEDEIDEIDADFERFLNGLPITTTVAPDRVNDRFDLKHVVPMQGRLVEKWKLMGIKVRTFGEVVSVVTNTVIPQQFPEKEFTLISVSYDGICKVAKKIKGKCIKPSIMYKASKGDLVFSNIRATDGAVGIVPEELDGALASGSYTILRCDEYEDTVYFWSVIRSHEIRADLMATSTGTSRYTTDWDSAKQTQIPWLAEAQRKTIAGGFIKSWALEKQIEKLREASLTKVKELGVESEDSKQRFRAYQPPK